MIKEAVCCLFACLVMQLPFAAQAEEDTHGLIMENHLHHSQESEKHHVHNPKQNEERFEKGVGVAEQLGGKINLDLHFTDENQQRVSLKEMITKPTLILPVYFSCPQACSMMLASLAQALNDVPLEPGQDYQVLAVSFDTEDTPELAQQAKSNYFKLITRAFPKASWRFMTGGQQEVDALLASFGYRLQKTGPGMFIHPNVLIAVAPDGQIIRYLYGLQFLPFDIGMALTEAAAGTPHISVRRILSYCFDYDSKSKTYVFKSFQIAAISIIVLLGLFFFFLLRKGNKPKTNLEEVRKGRRHD